MADSCTHCGGAIDGKLLDEFDMTQLGVRGLKVVLHKTVCENICQDCKVASHMVPNPKGLLAAVALYRATLAWKFNSDEIKFVRKAMNFSAKELADFLLVTPETVSRWENGHLVISSSCEKLLRVLIGETLHERAKLITYDRKKIMAMKIEVFRPQEGIEMALKAITIVGEDDKAEELYTRKAA